MTLELPRATKTMPPRRVRRQGVAATAWLGAVANRTKGFLEPEDGEGMVRGHDHASKEVTAPAGVAVVPGRDFTRPLTTDPKTLVEDTRRDGDREAAARRRSPPLLGSENHTVADEAKEAPADLNSKGGTSQSSRDPATRRNQPQAAHTFTSSSTGGAEGPAPWEEEQQLQPERKEEEAPAPAGEESAAPSPSRRRGRGVPAAAAGGQRRALRRETIIWISLLDKFATTLSRWTMSNSNPTGWNTLQLPWSAEIHFLLIFLKCSFALLVTWM
ncbi:hypothetical protein BRADI_4g11153v3 [Brachypodium distachyon]|uniref:Uncharacterized protein n=1 Tax=Brachypodium distachyon TaxID=15368 RepID=A0A0Q3EI83_BRADI|nr:hypothetical protein BRADI_4g11153v3 [Brachypodium distachyon]